jgi:hypothetical protein
VASFRTDKPATDALDVPELQHFRARLDRAAEHYKAFRSTWEAYLEERPHRLVAAVDDDGHGTLRMERVIPMPEELSLTLGEFLYQLRAALDNCLHAVAVIASGTNPPPGASALQWPICDTPAAFDKQRPRLKHLPARLVECLEAIQPYRAELPAWNSLRILNDLARVDRHRALHGSGELRPEQIDGNFEFEVEISDVEPAPGPDGKVMRPWGTLARRLRSLHQATLEYTEGLVHIATHAEDTMEEHA